MIVRALAALGRREEAEEIMSRLESESRQQYVRAEYLAMGHAALGEHGQRVRITRASLSGALGGPDLPAPRSGYALRGDPRYSEMVQRIGLR